MSRNLRADRGELQAQVLHIVRALGTCTVRDVHEEISRSRHVAYTTVLTVMSRLADRGVLERARRGRVGVFSLAVSDDANAAGRLVEQLLGRFGSIAVSQFVSQARTSPELLAELRRLVDDEQR